MTTQREAAPTLGLDDPWLAEPPKRSRLRLVLVLVLAAALVFYTGVQVQTRFGAGETAGQAAGDFTPPDGAGFPGAGQITGAGGSASDSAGDQGSGASDTGAVIGTVVSLTGNKLIVEDFGGTRRTVTLGSDVRVVLEAAGDRGDVKRGSTVQVNGQTGAQGQITANTITVR